MLLTQFCHPTACHPISKFSFYVRSRLETRVHVFLRATPRKTREILYSPRAHRRTRTKLTCLTTTLGDRIFPRGRTCALDVARHATRHTTVSRIVLLCRPRVKKRTRTHTYTRTCTRARERISERTRCDQVHAETGWFSACTPPLVFPYPASFEQNGT